MSLLADHGIGFPIPNTATQINDCRAFLYGYSILNLAAPLDSAIALASLFLTSQVGVKVATVKLVCIDTLVDPFWAGTLKWSQKTGQSAKVYPKPLKGYENGEAPEFYRSV